MIGLSWQWSRELSGRSHLVMEATKCNYGNYGIATINLLIIAKVSADSHDLRRFKDFILTFEKEIGIEFFVQS